MHLQARSRSRVIDFNKLSGKAQVRRATLACDSSYCLFNLVYFSDDITKTERQNLVMSRYDVEKFDPAPDPDLVCCICQCVLDKAVECPCRHVFCQLCIERWLTNRHTCPTCRKRTTKQDLQPVLPLLQNVLNRYCKLIKLCQRFIFTVII